MGIKPKKATKSQLALGRPSPLRSPRSRGGLFMGGKEGGKTHYAAVTSRCFYYESWIEFDSDPRLHPFS